MLIGPPIWPRVGNACGVPGGYIAGSRGSASLFTGVIGNCVSAYEVPEWKWRKAVIATPGIALSRWTTSAPGCEPRDVTSWHTSVADAGMAPLVFRFGMSMFFRSAQVSADA